MRDQLARHAPPLLTPESEAALDRPIDLVHLSRQSLGDRDLETELLSLFDRQAGQIMARLSHCNGNGDRRWLHDLSHTLKGSARAVGAGRVARAAQAYEEALFGSAGADELASHVARLAATVAEAQGAIRDLLAGG